MYTPVDMFANNHPERKIYVPKNSVNAYKTANGWSEYADYIKSIDDVTIYYTTINDEIIPLDYDNIISHTYQNGQGIIRFDSVVTEITEYMFYDNDDLLSISIPDSVTIVNSNTFDSCDNLVSIDLGESLKILWGLSNCNSLSEIIMPNTLERIEPYAVRMNGLTNLELPDNLKSIGEWAFQDCNNLTSVTLGSKIELIEDFAFQGCDKLANVYCKAVTPPAITIGPWSYWDAFNGVDSNLKIYVPIGSGAAYKAANGWKEYASIIEEKEM